MIQDEETYDLLDKYLSGNASLAEQILVQERLKLDPLFKDEFELYQFGRDLVIENRLRQTSDAIKQLRATEIKDKSTIKKALWGVALLFTLSAAVWGIYNFSNKTTNKLVSETATKNTEKEDQSTNPGTTTSYSQKIPVPEVELESQEDNIISSGSKEKSSNKTKQLVSTADPGQKEEISKPKEVLKVDEYISKPTPMGTHELPLKTNNLCDEVKITANFHSFATCKGKEEGIIEIGSVKGGKSPYVFHIGELSSTNKEIKNLSAGWHNIKVTDHNGCHGEIGPVLIKEKNCQQSQDLNFNPFIGETLDLPINKEKGGQIKVLERSGNLYYKKVFNAGNDILWDGTSVDGNVKAGFYIYIIEYTDGSVENGTITIVM